TDEGWAERLAGAFAAHPWVARVAAVRRAGPAEVRIDLIHRVPVLRVRPAGAGRDRAVDAEGVLLPSGAALDGLPRLAGEAARPGRAGAPWPDARVTEAADVGAAMRSHLDRLGARGGVLAREARGWVLLVEGATFLWGSAPGKEAASEASAAR